MVEHFPKILASAEKAPTTVGLTDDGPAVIVHRSDSKTIYVLT